jgi:hypothetical protein
MSSRIARVLGVLFPIIVPAFLMFLDDVEKRFAASRSSSSASPAREELDT